MTLSPGFPDVLPDDCDQEQMLVAILAELQAKLLVATAHSCGLQAELDGYAESHPDSTELEVLPSGKTRSMERYSLAGTGRVLAYA